MNVISYRRIIVYDIGSIIPKAILQRYGVRGDSPRSVLTKRAVSYINVRLLRVYAACIFRIELFFAKRLPLVVGMGEKRPYLVIARFRTDLQRPIIIRVKFPVRRFRSIVDIIRAVSVVFIPLLQLHGTALPVPESFRLSATGGTLLYVLPIGTNFDLNDDRVKGRREKRY